MMKNKYLLLLAFLVINTMMSCKTSGTTTTPLPAKTPPAKTLTDTSRPNLVFYLADDQNILDYGTYGATSNIKTPSVDRLASEGMKFSNAFTGQAICAPSRTQLYSGKYPLKNGMFLNHVKAKPDLITITKYMADLGYDVILAGKSHVKPKNVFQWTYEWHSVKVDGKIKKTLPIQKIDEYLKTTTKPFCMILSSELPHGPHYDVTGTDASDLDLYPYDGKKQSQAYMDRKAGYYKNIDDDDAQLGVILDMFEGYNFDNTIFMYSSDHGHVGKYTVYDSGLKVPFIVRWPGVITGGTTSDKLIHFTDVVPTFIDAAEGAPIADMDGKSFLPVLKGSSDEIHEYVYGVQTNQNIWFCKIFPSRMIRSKTYKYIRNYNSHEVVEQNFGDNEYLNAFIKIGSDLYPDTPYEELYDMQNDPFEQNNLAQDPSLATLKATYAADLVSWMTEQGDVLITNGPMPLLHAPSHPVDETSRLHKVPAELEGTLKKEDYLYLHY